MSHPALTVKTRLGAVRPVRRFFQVAGFSPPNSYLVHNSSINNLERGVLTRVFYAKGKLTPQPLPGIYENTLSKIRDRLCRQFSSTTPISRQEFVETYWGRKKVLYQQACDSLLLSSIIRRDSHIKAFVKAEFINSDDKPDPDPRIISPRDPRYNVEVGRYLRPIEHRLYTAIGRIWGGPTVLKGFNSEQTGKIFQDKWDKYQNPVAIGLDASRFDQHVSKAALEWEHSIYNRIFGSRELKRLLSWQLENHVTGYCRDGKLKYVVNGCRMSGDMNTALGNCLIMCALVYQFSKERNVQCSLANNGDDCTVIMESSDKDKFMTGLDEWFLKYGFSMKVEEPVYEMEGIEFCQTHPIRVDGRYIMCRNFPKALAKDCLSLKELQSEYVCKSWMDAVGQGGLSLCGGVPVFQEFYIGYIREAKLLSDKRAQRNSIKKKRNSRVELEGGMAWLSKGMKRKYQPVSEETRFSFYLAFGTTPDQQLALEDEIKKLKFRHFVRHGGTLKHLPEWF